MSYRNENNINLYASTVLTKKNSNTSIHDTLTLFVNKTGKYFSIGKNLSQWLI